MSEADKRRKYCLGRINDLLDLDFINSSCFQNFQFLDEISMLYGEAYENQEDVWIDEFARLHSSSNLSSELLAYGEEDLTRISAYDGFSLHRSLSEFQFFFFVRSCLEFTSENDKSLLMDVASNLNKYYQNDMTVEDLIVELLYVLDQFEFKKYEWFNQFESAVLLLFRLSKDQNSRIKISDKFLNYQLNEIKFLSTLWDYDAQLNSKLSWVKNQYIDGNFNNDYLFLSLIELEGCIAQSSLKAKDDLLVIISKMKTVIRPLNERLARLCEHEVLLPEIVSLIDSFMYYQVESL